ncbi:MAG: DUF1175 family protein [Terracidiphilus sp.]
MNPGFKRLLLLAFVALAILLLFLRMAVFTQHRVRLPRAEYRPSSLEFAAHPSAPLRGWGDSFGDGTPDFLRLSDPADREVFRRWFTLIADYQAVRPRADVPAEISDCAGLLRYAYREALKRHDDSWFLATGIEIQAPPGEIRAWHYPETPLKTGLFRVAPGPFDAADVDNGSFAQFADAKTLVERNAFFFSRNLRQAQPGDMLFFRQFGQSSPWHSMIVTRIGPEPGVVYHTGPDRGRDGEPPHGRRPVRGDPGEIRRVTLAELLDHPDPRWRPISANPNFLGVYRWNILRGNP